MEITKILNKDKTSDILSEIYSKTMVFLFSAFCGFFLAKVKIFGNLSPFCLPFLAVSPFLNLSPFFVLLGSLVGYLLTPFGALSFKYISGILIIFSIMMIFKQFYEKRQIFSSLLVGIIMFICGSLYLLISEVSVYNAVLVVLESILSSLSCYFINYLSVSIESKKVFKSQDIISFLLVILMFLSGVASINFYIISPCHILSIVLILMLFELISPYYVLIMSFVVSAMLGFLVSGAKYSFLAFSVSSILYVIFSKKKRALCVSLFFISYFTVLIINFKQTSNLIAFLEPISALFIYLALPKKKIYSHISSYLKAPAPRKDLKNLDNITNDLVNSLYAFESEINKKEKKIKFYPQLEEKIKKHLFLKGFSKINVICAFDILNNFYIDIEFSLNDQTFNKEASVIQISKIVNKPLFVKLYKTSETIVKIRLVEKQKFSVNCFAVSKVKNHERICGDSALAFKTASFGYVISLSDGMGSGKNAFMQSNFAISLCKKMLCASIDIKKTVDVINTFLLLNSKNLGFATLDILKIDLENGKSTFLKCGAADSFILRGNEITKIGAKTLPCGMNEVVDYKMISSQLINNDKIIMMSDGALSQNENINEIIKECKCDDINVFAKRLMDKITQNSNDNFDDDITVFIAEIKKNK